MVLACIAVAITIILSFTAADVKAADDHVTIRGRGVEVVMDSHGRGVEVNANGVRHRCLISWALSSDDGASWPNDFRARRIFPMHSSRFAVWLLRGHEGTVIIKARARANSVDVTYIVRARHGNNFYH